MVKTISLTPSIKNIKKYEQNGTCFKIISDRIKK